MGRQQLKTGSKVRKPAKVMFNNVFSGARIRVNNLFTTIIRMKKNAMLALCACCMVGFSGSAPVSAQNVPGNYEQNNIFASMQHEDKAAILMIHFGTTHADTRALTIDAINQKVGEAFPDVEIREAYSSRIIIKRLNDRGVKKQNPADALKQLKAEGFTHILVQPTTIIDGVEMESINHDVAELREGFKDLRVGTPLLFYTSDYEEVIDIITRDNHPDMAYVWVGHGTDDSATAQYAMLDYMLKEKGFKNHIVGCIEGYPYYEQALKQLKASGLKKVRLAPFMFVAGEHAKNDIAEDWKEELEAEGFSVEVLMQGMGEVKEIQDKFIRSLRNIADNPRVNIMDKKRIYEVTGEIME